MAEGFLQAGFVIPYASDKSEQAAQTYKHRHAQLGFDVTYYCGDVSELSTPETLSSFLGSSLSKIDVVCGGPPCQGFSLAGCRDPLDKRNQLVQSYIKILAQVKPKYFVMENVLGILSAKFIEYQGINKHYTDEKVINVLKSEFKEIGYPDVQIKMLDASDFGVPQKRQRVIFLGTRHDIPKKLTHPEPHLEDKVTSKDALQDLAGIALGTKVLKYKDPSVSKYQTTSREGRTKGASGKTVPATLLNNHEASKHSDLIIDRFSHLKVGESVKKMLSRLNVEQVEQLKTKKQSCRRIPPDEPSFTVLTLPDDLVHYEKNRILTVRETARLQSFDDSFEFLGKRTTGGNKRKLETPQYTLVGNAVPPLLAKAIADEVMKNLKNGE